MNDDFLGRIFKSSIVLSLGLSVLCAWYFGVARGVDFGVSALWGALNLRFLQFVVQESTRPEGARWGLLAGAGAVKFPLLYGVGAAWVLLRTPDPAATFAGLSLVLVVIVLKSLGRLLIESNWFSRPLPRGGQGR